LPSSRNQGKGKKMTGKKIVAANVHALFSPQSVAGTRPAHFSTDTSHFGRLGSGEPSCFDHLGSGEPGYVGCGWGPLWANDRVLSTEIPQWTSGLGTANPPGPDRLAGG
jgi:hypothetical protein